MSAIRPLELNLKGRIRDGGDCEKIVRLNMESSRNLVEIWGVKIGRPWGVFRGREPKGGERVVSEFGKVRERRRFARTVDGGWQCN